MPQPSLAAGGHIPKRHKLNIGHGNPNSIIINNKDKGIMIAKKMNHDPIGNCWLWFAHGGAHIATLLLYTTGPVAKEMKMERRAS